MAGLHAARHALSDRFGLTAAPQSLFRRTVSVAEN
jgi:hypothetical protein